MGNLNFDASEVAPMTDSYEPLPQGWYQMRVISADIRLIPRTRAVRNTKTVPMPTSMSVAPCSSRDGCITVP